MKLFTIRVYWYDKNELYHDYKPRPYKITINPTLIWRVKEIADFPELIQIYIGTDEYIIDKADFDKFGFERF